MTTDPSENVDALVVGPYKSHMYRLTHYGHDKTGRTIDLGPSATFDQLSDAKKEAIMRTRLPDTPHEGTIYIGVKRISTGADRETPIGAREVSFTL
jgi:hypothetical protein